MLLNGSYLHENFSLKMKLSSGALVYFSKVDIKLG